MLVGMEKRSSGKRHPMPDAPQSAPKLTAGDRGLVVEFPATLERGGGTPENNLPLRLSGLVGREREIKEVEGLLSEHRLLTLTGPGGSGKTRLALAVAFEVAHDYEQGAWLVELAPLSEPELVAQAVASVLGVREAPGSPLTETLADHLLPRTTLLVLDNCEHLIGACASLAEALLGRCPNLKVLATSREALGVEGETLFVVPPLSLPDPRCLPALDSLSEYEAARLFVERARAVRPGFEITDSNALAVAQVCHRLDGMPLAIELAAARARVLSAEQISERLDDAFRLLAGRGRPSMAHHGTLRATMDWSHELLSEEEKVLFRRLSVFAGGFTLQAVEAVCAGAGIEEAEVLDLLGSLVDKSLVLVTEQDGETRYRLLETVRQYASEKLEDPGEAWQVCRRHAEHYLALAEEAEQELREQEAWLERLEIEHANLRAALSWALDRQDELPGGRAELGLRLAAALAQGRFWSAYGPSEGLRWLERGLAETSTSPSPVRAKALREAGWLATHQGDYQRSAALVEESMALFEALEDKPGVAASLVHLGQMALHGGDRERARALHLEAEALRRELSDPQAVSLLLYFLGFAALDEGDHDRAAALSEEGLELNRELGDLRGIALCLTVLGVAALEQGDAERAAALYEEDLRVLRGLRDKLGIAYGLRGMACVASLRGDAARAARLWGAVEALQEAIGLPLSPFDRNHPDYEGLLAAARPRLDEAAWEAALAEGRAMTPDEAVEYVLGTEEAAAPPPEEPASSLLSEREAEILVLVAEGLTNPQVAERLYVSPRTVGQHLRSVYRKLGVSSRTAAARVALERHLI
jgi:predicted ATPase/DNA-binding CsgD family transcriptional regulator